MPDESAFADVVDVEDGLSKNTRCLYPKVGAKTLHLNDFLQRRLHLKNLEERRLELHSKSSVDNDPFVKFVDDAKKRLWAMVAKLKDTQIVATTTTAAAPTTKTTNDAESSDQLCYSALCRQSPPDFECYSVTCKKNKKNQAAAAAAAAATAAPVPTPAPSVIISNPALQEASSLFVSVIKEAATHGIAISAATEFSTKEAATAALQNLVKVLMQKKEEAASKIVVNGDRPSDESGSEEKKPERRIYSSTDTSGKLYLKRIKSVSDPKAKSKEIKYPPAPSFHSKSRDKYNILILAKHDVKRLARKAGQVTAEGFNYAAKANNQVWPYPCPRPTFKTAWLFRTACLESLQAVGLQLRIIWACLKWDDMQTKPATADGKHQVTSDSAIITTEILKTRTSGRFLERTEYLQRKVVIPLDVPRAVKEVTPIRSGLRKRKRAESPQQLEPKVTEEWIEEEKLELWEIRGFKEKLDRDKSLSLTRSRTGTVVKEPQRLDPGDATKNRKSDVDVKAKMEEQLRLQREALQRKSVGVIRTPATATPPAPNQTVLRQIRNPDGTVSIVRAVARPMVGGMVTSSPTATTPITTGGPPAPKRIFVTRDGKVISEQILTNSPVQQMSTMQAIKPATPVTPAASATPVAAPGAAGSGSQQKVQIVRSSDGKIQVRGLLPGQQLVQTPDGKLQIISQQVALKTNATPIQLGTPTPMVAANNSSVAASPAVQPPNKLIVASPNQAVTPTANQMVTPVQQQQLIGTPVKMVTPNAGLTPGPGQIVATQLAPGSQIPPGTTAFVSGGKTYCIPKASATLAGSAASVVSGSPAASMAVSSPTQQPPAPVANVAQPPQANLTPALTPNVVTATTTAPTAAVQPQQPKQMVEVKTLGQNVVSFKGNQMIVQGPDIAQAQQIARQLASGSARLAMLNGKQVLVSTTSTIIQQQQQQPQPAAGQPQPLQIVQQQQPQQVVQPQQQVVQQLQPQTQLLQQQLQAVQPQPQVLQPQPALQTQLQPAVQQTVMTSPLSVQSPPAPAALPQQVMQSPLKNESVQLPTEPLPPVPANEQQQTQPSPVTSPIKQPMEITAQLVQTPQGPRIILQGIQGASLPKEFLMKIQQQVKTQLLKAQAEAKQQNRVPPTKIAIQLHPSIQAQLEKDQPKSQQPAAVTEAATAPVTQPQPEMLVQQVASPPQPQVLLPTQPISSPMTSPTTAAPPAQVMNFIRSPRPIAPQTPQQSLASPRPVVLQQIVGATQGQRFVLIGPGGARMAMIASSASPVTPVQKTGSPQQPLSVVLPSTPNPPVTIFSNASNTATTTVTASNNLNLSSPANANNDKFELTPDYIQKAISDALKSQNLSPEIEQKLLAMQSYTYERNTSTPVVKKVPAPIDPLSGEPMDDEWEPTSRPRSSAGGRKRKPATATSVSSPAPEVVENSVPVMASPPRSVAPVVVSAAPEMTPRVRTKSEQKSGSGQPVSHPVSGLTSPVAEEKKRQQAINKLQQILLKHKDQLKKEIARKRAMQEKELQVEIHREIEKAKVENQVKLCHEFFFRSFKRLLINPLAILICIKLR